MNILKNATACVALLVILAAGATAQDLMTPPMSPPVLTAPAPATGLVVPPRPTAGASQPVRSPASQPPVAAQAAAEPAAAPAGGRSVNTEQFDDWAVECFEPAFDELACQATLRVIAGDASQVVMVFALTGRKDGPVAIQAALPLGISLEAAVQIVIGTGYQNRIPISRCTPAGCLIEGTATDELIAALRSERAGTVVVESETGEKIRLAFSLMGFNRALERAFEGNG